MNRESLLALAAGALLLLAVAVVMVRRDARRERRDRARRDEARALGLHLPPSLHPVIDPDVCIGSLACVAACPEGDVLGNVGGVGTLVAGANCVGHGRCAAECPVGAIRLVFGTSERGVDIPRVSSFYESTVSGLYVAGELGGMGLIRNAVRQGVAAVRHMARSLPDPVAEGEDDLVIVGAGPAGIAAGLAATEAGLRFRLLEQDGFGGTVANYPRQKIVLTEPVDLPLAGRLHRRTMSKEELLETWARLRDEHRLPVQERERVDDVLRSGEGFLVRTARAAYPARRVLLAIGRRGNPRRLGVPGEDLSTVTYRLRDPEQYRDRSVLVVGGGDAAAEAACAVADAGGEVALSYRGHALNRCKPDNRRRVSEFAAAGRLRPLWATVPLRIEPARVHLAPTAGDGAALAVAAEYVIVCAGGELPTALLARVGVKVDRHYGAPA